MTKQIKADGSVKTYSYSNAQEPKIITEAAREGYITKYYGGSNY